MTRQPFRAIRRDLFFDLECTCLDPRFAHSEIAHLFKTKVHCTGYADDNFFDNVNAEPRVFKCKCGREFQIQWFPNGVEAKWL